MPVRTGSTAGARMTNGSVATGGASILRRIVGNDRVERFPGPATPLVPPNPGLEAELAERLDNVLDIAGRLAASHDRAELFQMIVEETNRALRTDATTIRILRDDRLEVVAWAGLSDDVGRRLPSSDRRKAGSARSCGPGTSWPSRTRARTRITVSSATTGSSLSRAISLLRWCRVVGSSARSPP